MDFRSKLCVSLGYSSSHRGYKCLHVPSSHLYISQHVIFDENLFPFASNIFFLPLLDRMPFIHMCPHLFLPRHLICLHYPWCLIILHMVLSLVSHHLHQCLLMCLTLFLHMLTPLPHHLLPPPLFSRPRLNKQLAPLELYHLPIHLLLLFLLCVHTPWSLDYNTISLNQKCSLMVLSNILFLQLLL